MAEIITHGAASPLLPENVSGIPVWTTVFSSPTFPHSCNLLTTPPMNSYSPSLFDKSLHHPPPPSSIEQFSQKNNWEQRGGFFLWHFTAVRPPGAFINFSLLNGIWSNISSSLKAKQCSCFKVWIWSLQPSAQQKSRLSPSKSQKESQKYNTAVYLCY